MQIVIKGTKTIAEFKERYAQLEDMAETAYIKHLLDDSFNEGYPVKARYFDNSSILIEYSKSTTYKYKNIDTPKMEIKRL